MASSALVLILSLLCYTTFTSACGSCKPTPKPKPKPSPPPPSSVPCPPPTKPTPTPKPKPSSPPPSPVTSAPPPATKTCPRDTLKLGVCADLLGLVNVVVGSPATSNCCALISGLADLEAAVCLCTAIKANVLGINLNVPVTLSLLLSACEKKVPSGFQCA